MVGKKGPLMVGLVADFVLAEWRFSGGVLGILGAVIWLLFGD